MKLQYSVLKLNLMTPQTSYREIYKFKKNSVSLLIEIEPFYDGIMDKFIVFKDRIDLIFKY